MSRHISATAALRKRALAAALCLAGLAWAQSVQAGSFTTTYRNGSNCSSTYNIKGVEPDDGNRHPVFLYFVGTSEQYDNASAMAAVRQMTAKGFVAATVQYPNATFGHCGTLGERASCAFDASSAYSAITQLCSRAAADCSKGVVVGGFSQGSIIATLAKNYDDRVVAAWGMGTHITYAVYNLAACMADGQHRLPSSRLRIVNGELDYYGGDVPAGRNQAQQVTGRPCASNEYHCLGPDGSGFRVVRNVEVQDGQADHCYMRATGACRSGQDRNDPGWESGSEDWGLPAALNWLNQFVSH
ncbi:hypothetical protein [Caldimonas brevitalea]|uniref:Uncharacterized protein n=1 Tax=Caldimonas brevitalea TaxID=413882 RepID=A0A0G3BZC5_9BURK|nr:hypothetical protein [Caldimonas brevitalea]AKJ31865.1 hypothetical protein AAW51_5174 [Caldimonas brevitalea]